MSEYMEMAEACRLSTDNKRLLAEVEALRKELRETTAVAITMLYDSHPEDVVAEFKIPELHEVVEASRHLTETDVQVESVYRKAWELAKGGRTNG